MTVQLQLQGIDDQKMQAILHAESVCRKILKPHLEYSPEVQYWADHLHSLIALLRLRRGKGQNYSNIYHAARACEIKKARELSVLDLEQCLVICKEWLVALEEISPFLCEEHNRRCLQTARDKIDMEAVNKSRRTFEKKPIKNMETDCVYHEKAIWPECHASRNDRRRQHSDT